MKRHRRYFLRCSHGHLFSNSFWLGLYGGGAVLRLVFAGYTRCPVGNHWALVKYAKEADLTPEERETLKQRERLDDRHGVKIFASIYLLGGASLVVYALATHHTWEALLAAPWLVLAVCGAVYMRVLSRS